MRSLFTSFPLRCLFALGSALAALAVVVTLVAGLGGSPQPADAAVVRSQGFAGTVLGWSSWYGTYDLAGLGPAWCIDHGSHAPDADLGYVPTDVTDASPDTKAAMAWALVHHPVHDGIDAAALMLVLHDLMGAQYPFGPLSLHQMGPGDLAGFGGHEATVLDRARSIRDDAVAHGHLRGPLTLTAEAPPVDAGQQGELTVRLTDANGAPIERAGIHVHADGASLLAGGHATTASDGTARLPFRAAEGPNRFRALAVAGDPNLHAWGPTLAPAQRVARPATVEVVTYTGFDVTPPDGGIELDKTDASTGRPLAGAVFDLAFDADHDGTFETPLEPVTSGSAPVVVDGLAPGNYQMTETSAPPGYAPLADPFVVTVPAGQVVEVEVANVPRSTVAFQKVPTGEVDPVQVTLSGAVFAVTGPHDQGPEPPVIGDEGDDSGEDPPPTNDGDTPVANGDPLPRRPATADAPDALRAPSTEPAAEEAEEPTPEPAPEVGRCTTDDTGRCGLADGALLAGRRYCYQELVAPPGFGLAEPGCFTAGPPATVHTVEVDEPSTFTPVDATKRDATDERPLTGAVYDLYRDDGLAHPTVDADDPPNVASPDLPGVDDPPRRSDDQPTFPPPQLPAPPAPDDAAPVPGYTWVGRAESDGAGRLRWPAQVPGHRYCAVEVTAPEGYERTTEPTCTEPLVAGEPAHLELLDHPIAPPDTEETAPPANRPGAPTAPPEGAPPTSPATVPDRPRHQSALPVAGGEAGPLAAIAVGLLLLGGSATWWSRRSSHPRGGPPTHR